MKFARLIPVFLVSTLCLAACGKEEAEQSQASATAGATSLLALVPADTPYLGGNLAPVPDAIIDSYLARFEPALVSLQAELSKAKAELEAKPDELAEDTGARVVHALLQELDGKLNRPGMESLGFDLSSEQVVYGISTFPVVRASLSDANALRATVQRVLDSSGVEAPQLEFQGQSYWRINLDTHDSDSGDMSGKDAEAEGGTTEPEDKADVGFYVAILPDHLALGVLPVASEDIVLPTFLALQKPADSVAAKHLGEINQRFGYSDYGTGVLDLQKFADELLNPESLVGQLLASHGHDLGTKVNDQCRSEINSVIAHTPYFFAGIKELSESAVASQLVVETDSSIAAELLNLVADVPVADAASSYLAELALGLKVGPVRDFLRSKAMAVVDQPYQCELLQAMNTQAQEAADQLNQPIPPMVNNLFGLRVAVSRIGGQAAPESAEGLIALHVTQPEMLVGMAQMLVPNIAEMDLTVGAPPVQIPAEMIPISNLVVYAAQADTAIGLSVGEGQQNGLVEFINQESESNGTFLSVNYDSAAFQDVTGKMGANSLDAGGHSDMGDFAESAQSVYQSMADRSDTRLSFTKDGLVIDSKVTFKNP